VVLIISKDDVQSFFGQVISGITALQGTYPFSLEGVSAIDSTNNNLTLTKAVDNYGNIVSTDTFGLADQPFFNISTTPSTNSYVRNTCFVDSSPRTIGNLFADMSASNPAFAAIGTGNPGAPAFFIPPSNAPFTLPASGRPWRRPLSPSRTLKLSRTVPSASWDQCWSFFSDPPSLLNSDEFGPRFEAARLRRLDLRARRQTQPVSPAPPRPAVDCAVLCRGKPELSIKIDQSIHKNITVANRKCINVTREH